MVFGNKNKGKNHVSGQHVLRGRDQAEQGQTSSAAGNPLARRIHAADEPDTIDLTEPGRFHAAVEGDDPPTSAFGDAGKDRQMLITRDEKTGKFHVQPGTAEVEVALAGEPVLTPTELRRGDVIRIGDAEFKFLPRS